MITPKDRERLNKFTELALTTAASVYETFRITEQVIEEHVPGCLVECGVYCGTQCAAMAHAVMKHGENRKVHLFDSFYGIPEAGPEDDQIPGAGSIPLGSGKGRLVSSGISVASLQFVQEAMYRWRIDAELLEYHRGWFQGTVPFFRPEEGIAILRLDGDLYESTKVCLEYLYPLLNPQGFLIIDDWNLRGCRKAVEDYFESIKLDPKFESPDVGYDLKVHRNPQRLIRKKP